eukprot:CAMPEP_0183357822 /NCGR_PEP_ID=MMETSP0164_2-20130417/47491_1 /TAXON_ID=221442 /ORGANISM="Coccolithus pelagicus ssp braarudi, Strain PLY182g" /LENGTH=173 /DNA_ID=CAMNT_0025531553 /DNA_START=109 /DNA_END=632 /DNA_ORIENTATION=-
MASRAYRELLKAQRVVFNQDFATLRAARIETRSQFMLNANAPVEKVPQLLQDASDAAHFMKANVAQTVRNDSGNYELNPRPELSTEVQRRHLYPVVQAERTSTDGAEKPRTQPPLSNVWSSWLGLINNEASPIVECADAYVSYEEWLIVTSKGCLAAPIWLSQTLRRGFCAKV